MSLLHGQVALVTGGSRGIGAGIAKALGRHGADVAVNYAANRSAAQAVVGEIEQHGVRGLAVGADVTDETQVSALVTEATEALGAISILVCNAAGDTRGMANRIHDPAPVLDRAEVISAAVREQLDAVFTVCRQVVPGMRAAGSGAIILVGSSASATTSPRPEGAEVAIAKAAQDALARQLAADLAPDGIRVNTVAPGFVSTDAHQDVNIPTLSTAIADTTPTGRVSTPGDIGNIVVALASELTQQVVGARILADGGHTIS